MSKISTRVSQEIFITFFLADTKFTAIPRATKKPRTRGGKNLAIKESHRVTSRRAKRSSGLHLSARELSRLLLPLHASAAAEHGRLIFHGRYISPSLSLVGSQRRCCILAPRFPAGERERDESCRLPIGTYYTYLRTYICIHLYVCARAIDRRPRARAPGTPVGCAFAQDPIKLARAGAYILIYILRLAPV